MKQEDMTRRVSIVDVEALANGLLRLRPDAAHHAEDHPRELSDEPCDLCVLARAVLDLRERLDDWTVTAKKVMAGECAPDEKHCTCVPVLQRALEVLAWAYHTSPDLDDCTDEEAVRRAADQWRMVRERAKAGHSGDCTKEPHPCAACQVEHVGRLIAIVAEEA